MIKIFMQNVLKRFLIYAITLVGTVFFHSGMAQMVERLLSIHLLSSLPWVPFPVFPTYRDCMDFYYTCLIKQPNGSLSRMCVQAYMMVK